MDYIVYIQCDLKCKCKGIISSGPDRISLVLTHYNIVIFPVIGRRNQNLFSLPANVNSPNGQSNEEGKGDTYRVSLQSSGLDTLISSSFGGTGGLGKKWQM